MKYRANACDRFADPQLAQQQRERSACVCLGHARTVAPRFKDKLNERGSRGSSCAGAGLDGQRQQVETLPDREADAMAMSSVG
jgi:hypothetical protein